MSFPRRSVFIVASLLLLLGGLNLYQWNRSLVLSEGFTSLNAETSRANQKLKDSENRLAKTANLLKSSVSASRASIKREFIEAENILMAYARQDRPSHEVVNSCTRLRYSLKNYIADAANQEERTLDLATAYWRLGQLFLLTGDNRDALVALSRAARTAEELGESELASYCQNSLGCALAITQQPCQTAFHSAIEILPQDRRNSISYALQLRNLALAQPYRNRRAIELLSESISILDILASDLEEAFIVLVDVRMVLCEYLWATGNLADASDQCEKVIEMLETVLPQLEQSPQTGHHLEIRTFSAGLKLAKRNSELLSTKTASDTDPTDLAQSYASFRWKPLFQLDCDMVSPDREIGLTMAAEFDHQTGFLVPWGIGNWSHQAAIDVIKSLIDQGHVIVGVDDWNSYNEVRRSLLSAGVSPDRVQYEYLQFEVPWLRDYGPIVATSAQNNAVWLDSALTRTDMETRVFMDKMPQLVGNHLDVRVVPFPVHVEGGMILSNGKGIVIGSKGIITKNLRYGFTREALELTLRRATGAKELVFVDTLLGEPTEHIDMFMTFVSPDTVVVGEISDNSDPNKRRLDEVSETLAKVSFGGDRLRVIRVPTPSTKDGVFYTYTNVVFANGKLLVPSYAKFADEYEQKVQAIYQRELPNWKIEFIESTEIILRGGALHCMISNLGDAAWTTIDQ